jgi:multiple sugar transport system substrate-binding protein
MRNFRMFVVLVIVFILVLGAIGPSAAQDKPFEGITVRILSFVGPQVTEPLLRRGPDFEELTAHTSKSPLFHSTVSTHRF